MKNYLWKINKENLKKTNLNLYLKFLKRVYRINLDKDFTKIWRWSIENPKIFWKSIWDVTKIKGNCGKVLLKTSNIFLNNKFFPEAKLNYAQNLLKKKNKKKAIIFK